MKKKNKISGKGLSLDSLQNISDPNGNILKRVIYPDKEFFTAFGPLIQGELRIPSDLEKAMRDAGKEIPKPVSGLILLDTGSSHTTVAEHVVKELGLNPVSTAITHGAHGEKEVFTYYVSLDIPTDKRVFNLTTIVTSADMEKISSVIEKGLHKKVIGLLGRDFLFQVKLILDATNCELVLVENNSRIKIL
jgi:hypothetical protein